RRDHVRVRRSRGGEGRAKAKVSSAGGLAAPERWKRRLIMATRIPTNAAAFTIEELIAITDGVLLATGGAAPGGDSVVGISTDTRTLVPGGVFVALQGERFDGHAHLLAAFAGGARVALVERDVTLPIGLGLIRVQSTLRALGAIA